MQKRQTNRILNMKRTLLLFLTLTILSGCEFISNTFDYKDKTEEFVEALLQENYDRCVELFAMGHEMARNTNPDSLKAGLGNFRNLVVDNFGSELDYSLMKSEKTWSTIEENNTPPNTTVVLVQFSNETHFGVFKVLFDDQTKKILNINTLDVKEQIPNMTLFWLFGLIVICVPIFNIYVIRLIKKSDLKKKWLKYIALVFFNVPAITYSAVGGFSFSLLSFQILLGMSFNYMGYLNSAWTLGIPLGGLYWLWKIKTRKPNEDVEQVELDKTEEEK
ncbi:hypothetical protein PBT90_12415 [Algoriphagus halophytocola]|uniref:DUF4878 domain-containing protein n=1 Tax=Algoriphagus halophytocola TaxID=2991499 RepID=A0ABY6MK81_9BACT|nr:MULTISPECIES: hypothetical protein [unclassified Algoriphagus]UZD24188.1 hypothetical protein OM944_06740 [Algoriphagus sp. TR-M5]WBL41557.1 hypothetical protein PBT90_12415 [Algoriphagus sp. TR-M9]